MDTHGREMDPITAACIGNRSAGGCPPHVQRGQDSQTVITDSGIRGYVGVHWFRATFRKEHRGELLRVIDLHFGEHEEHAYGLWVYDHSWTWDAGGVSLNERQGEQDGEGLTKGLMTLEVPGSALDLLGPIITAEFFKSVADLDPRVGRLDFFFDDPLRRITPHEIYEQVYELDKDGNEVRRDFRGFLRIKPGPESSRRSPRLKELLGGANGLVADEVDFGRRGRVGSGKYLRIYDKRLESDGENPCVRYELEMTDRTAHTALFGNPERGVKGLLACGYDMAAWRLWIGGVIGTSIDFIKRSERYDVATGDGDKNVDRCERYEWWQSIIEDIGAASLTTEKLDSNLEHKREHFQKQYCKSIKCFRLALGEEDFFAWLLEMADGELGLKPHHRRLIDEYIAAQKLKAATAAEFNNMMLATGGRENDDGDDAGGEQ